jgi:hypothetical protein
MIFPMSVCSESATRDPSLLPKRVGEHHAEMLGREPGQAAGHGRGGASLGGPGHEQGRRHDTGRSGERVPVLLQSPWSVDVPHPSLPLIPAVCRYILHNWSQSLQCSSL